MISPEKEIVPFIKKIDVNEGDKKGNVEKWLLEIENVMRETLKSIAKKSIEDKDIRTKWVLKYPAMTTLMGDMMSWTNKTEAALMASSS
jgi:dynein heavy chain, axonemal